MYNNFNIHFSGKKCKAQNYWGHCPEFTPVATDLLPDPSNCRARAQCFSCNPCRMPCWVLLSLVKRWCYDREPCEFKIPPQTKSLLFLVFLQIFRIMDNGYESLISDKSFWCRGIYLIAYRQIRLNAKYAQHLTHGLKQGLSFKYSQRCNKLRSLKIQMCKQ